MAAIVGPPPRDPLGAGCAPAVNRPREGRRSRRASVEPRPQGGPRRGSGLHGVIMAGRAGSEALGRVRLGVGFGFGQRQPDRDRHALPGRALGVDRAAVGLDDRRDDREAEPGAAPAARPRGVGAVEPLEHPCRLLLGRVPGPCVGDHDDRVGRRPVAPGRRPAVPSGVCDRTLASRLSRTWRSRCGSPSTSTGWVATRGDRPLGRDGPGRLDRLGAQRHQFDRDVLDGLALVQPRQREQVGDQALHPGRLGPDACHHPRRGPRCLSGSAPLEQLGVGRDGGDRRAQLV